MRIDVKPDMEANAGRVKVRNHKSWRKGVALAELMRREWSIDRDAVDNRDLADLSEVAADWIHDGF